MRDTEKVITLFDSAKEITYRLCVSQFFYELNW